MTNTNEARERQLAGRERDTANDSPRPWSSYHDMRALSIPYVGIEARNG